jgi:hypothetical protein
MFCHFSTVALRDVLDQAPGVTRVATSLYDDGTQEVRVKPLQVRLYDLASGELAGCGVDPHAAPVSLLHARPGPTGAATLLLSSSRQVTS